mgnify:CR=1 FL=1
MLLSSRSAFLQQMEAGQFKVAHCLLELESDLPASLTCTKESLLIINFRTPQFQEWVYV